MERRSTVCGSGFQTMTVELAAKHGQPVMQSRCYIFSVPGSESLSGSGVRSGSGPGPEVMGVGIRVKVQVRICLRDELEVWQKAGEGDSSEGEAMRRPQT